MVADDISINGLNLKGFEFGLATIVSDDFIDYPIDGILGLAFEQASVEHVPTFMDSLVSWNTHQVVFAFVNELEMESNTQRIGRTRCHYRKGLRRRLAPCW